jgi:adenylate cyclase
VTVSEPHPYQRFFAELKRRHVFRVAAVYGATAFVIVQAADVLQEALRLPEAFLTGVAVLALLGFPLALVLAWAYERTPDGVRKTVDAETGEIESIASAPAGKRWPIGLAALAGAALLATSAWWVLKPDSTEDRSYDSIAVLPFVNMTGEAEDEYLADGMAEELLNALVRIEGLKVASRTSAFAFKGSATDARTIGDSLGVATVLEGSVRRSDQVLRVTAQLIDAEDGFHLWSETYDRAPADLLQIQDDLTAQILEALSAQLGTEAAPNIASRGTESSEAFDFYLQGRHFWNKRSPEDMRVAVGLFEEAIEADSSFGAAYAAIAESYAVPAGWGDDPLAAMAEADRYARMALAIDPTLAQAHASLGWTAMSRDLDLVTAEEHFLRALELDPEYPTAHQWYSEVLAATGRRDEAVRMVQEGEALDPSYIIRYNAARILYLTGRYEEAIHQAREVVLAQGSYTAATLYLEAISHYMLGDNAATLATFEQAGAGEQIEAARTALVEGAPVATGDSTLNLLLRFADAGVDPVMGEPFSLLTARFWMKVDTDSAIVRLERLATELERTGLLIDWFDVIADVAFDDIRDDPRLAELNARFGL